MPFPLHNFALLNEIVSLKMRVMDFRKQRLSIKDTKEMDVVNYLSSLGYEPSKIRNNDYWYLSPLREEKTPSFKINRKLNRWYDHDLGKGGNLIDFATLYYQCTISELLESLSGSFSIQKLVTQKNEPVTEPQNRLTILGDTELSSYALLRYLEQRYISVEIANRYCREVRYQLNNKAYYGIGFNNDSGGFEIRNPYFKFSMLPKDITTFKNGVDEVAVFEGFMDFLSFKTLHKNLPENSQDFVVLNSLSFFERARLFMEDHRSIRFYLDRDVAGKNCTQHVLSMSTKYQDESRLYRNYKDLNDWLINFDNSPKKQLRQKIR